MVMKSLALFLSISPPLQNHHYKTLKPHLTTKSISEQQDPVFKISSFHPHFSLTKRTKPFSLKTSVSKTPFSSFTLLTNLLLLNPLPSLALSDPLSQQVSTNDKINLEAILISIDDFFTRYPFFVSGVTFIWLIVIPLTKKYLKKFKYISAIDAFCKLRDDPNSVLIDIRDQKSLTYLGSPNLKILNKRVVQVYFDERDDEQVFLNSVKGMFSDPANTSIIVLDNFDGNSLKVAELLVNIGFKEAYAIKAGVRGKDGWQAIQEKLLPPSVHIYPRKKDQTANHLEVNVALNQPSEEKSVNQSEEKSVNQSEEKSVNQSEGKTNESVKKSIESNPQAKLHPSSPYTKYPDLKPPSSPTPAKPRT